MTVNIAGAALQYHRRIFPPKIQVRPSEQAGRATKKMNEDGDRRLNLLIWMRLCDG